MLAIVQDPGELTEGRYEIGVDSSSMEETVVKVVKVMLVSRVEEPTDALVKHRVPALSCKVVMVYSL